VKKGKLLKLFDAPLSTKIVALNHLYWRIRTALFYRFVFRRMGRQCVIYRPLIISNADCIELGDCVNIRDGIRLEAIRDPYGRIPLLTIGSNTNIEQGVHIICHSRVKIGRDVSITGRCAIVDVTHPYDDATSAKIGNCIADDDSFVEIGDGAFLGYGTVVLPNVRIGKRAVIGANSVVTRDVPDFAIAAGAPAKVIKLYSHKLQRWIPSDDLK
jgi:acetyltransferase-like isoleucine patch superfamily enzyme